MTQYQPQQTSYQPGPSSAPPNMPGKTLGVVGLVASCLGVFTFGSLGLVGLILSVVAKKQSAEAGFPNQPAKIGIIIGIITMVIGILFAVGGVVLGLLGSSTSGF